MISRVMVEPVVKVVAGKVLTGLERPKAGKEVEKPPGELC
jgi:hypothetical protein